MKTICFKPLINEAEVSKAAEIIVQTVLKAAYPIWESYSRQRKEKLFQDKVDS